MNAGRLVEMANDIAVNLSAYPSHADAVEAMVLHLQRFWEPAMRARIVACLHDDANDADALSPLAREAIVELARRLDEPPPPTRRGASDAG